MKEEAPIDWDAFMSDMHQYGQPTADALRRWADELSGVIAAFQEFYNSVHRGLLVSPRYHWRTARRYRGRRRQRPGRR